jgi:anaerobic selenocysteine-containing dehydrogenase
MIVILNPRQAMAYGITVHSKVAIIKLNGEEVVADVSFSERVSIGTIAISDDVAKKY